jgi:hypothetical protein
MLTVMHQIALMKTFADDESYNSGHGHAYKEYGVDPEKGAVVVVRPDHCELPIIQCTDCWTELTCGRCCQGFEDRGRRVPEWLL